METGAKTSRTYERPIDLHPTNVGNFELTAA